MSTEYHDPRLPFRSNENSPSASQNQSTSSTTKAAKRMTEEDKYASASGSNTTAFESVSPSSAQPAASKQLISSTDLEEASKAEIDKAPPASYMRVSRISCTACRVRKLRCDRIMPCSTCVRRGLADSCYQDDKEVGANPQISSAQRTKDRTLNKSGSPRPQKRSRASVSEHEERKHASDFYRSDCKNDAHTVLQQNLAETKRHINALASLACDSNSSIEALLQALQASTEKRSAERCQKPHKPQSPHGSGADGRVVWRDIAADMPSIEECERLMDFYFQRLSVYIRINQYTQIAREWQSLINGQGLEPNKVTVLCALLALAETTVPPHLGVKKYTADDHERWIKLFGDPMTTSTNAKVEIVEDNVMALALSSIYSLWNGRHDLMWEYMGAAIRRGFMIGLFDEQHKTWRGRSLIQKEYRRRLAWYMISFERLQAFIRHIPSALHPDNVHLCLPSFAHDALVEEGNIPPARIAHTYPTTAPDGRLQTHVSAKDNLVVKFVLVEVVAVCHDFLSLFCSMTPAERYQRALQIDDLCERTLIDGLSHSGVDTTELRPTGFLSTQALEKCRLDRQLGVNLWVSHLFFLRCMVTRRFLTDENAPPSLRFVSITYAQGIVSTIPTLTRIFKEGLTPIQITWQANHLLCAATAFAVVILGHDTYGGIDGGEYGRSMNGSFAPPTTFPQEQVQWLADRIFSSVECLAMLVEHGNAAATAAKELLDRLCGSQDELRTLYRKRFRPFDDSSSLPLSFYKSSSGTSIRNSPLPVRLRSTEPSTYSVAAAPAHSMMQQHTPSPLLPWQRSTTGAASDSQTSLSPITNASAAISPSTMSGDRQTTRVSLPPMQAYPPAPALASAPSTRQCVAEYSLLSSPSSNANCSAAAQPLVGRFVHASSLLDAVLMETPADLYQFGTSNSTSLLDSLFDTDASSVTKFPAVQHPTFSSSNGNGGVNRQRCDA